MLLKYFEVKNIVKIEKNNFSNKSYVSLRGLVLVFGLFFGLRGRPNEVELGVPPSKTHSEMPISKLPTSHLNTLLKLKPL